MVEYEVYGRYAIRRPSHLTAVPSVAMVTVTVVACTCMCDKHKVSVAVRVYSMDTMWAIHIYTLQQNDKEVYVRELAHRVCDDMWNHVDARWAIHIYTL